MKSITELTQKRPALAWLLFFATIAVVFLLGLLASSIIERRAEALFVNTPKTVLRDGEVRNEKWGENYPREFQSYYGTADTSFRSKHGGNAMVDMLEEVPEMVVLWAGYLFSRDYNQGRGHYYAIEDIYNSLRTGAPMSGDAGPQPTTCWACKSPDVPRMMKEEGITQYYSGMWARLGSEIVNPIGCADCHNASTANLQISRPALIEAFQRQGKDVTSASYQEMRSLVCAQCHVEYYFNKKVAEGANYLTFPWDKGMTVEEMEKYYDEIEFSDWTHALSRAPMLKAQHPDYEVAQFGIHAQRGVACADCHMPYMRVGGLKISDHHVRSPLLNINNSCQTCHKAPEAELLARAERIQDKTAEMKDKALGALMELIDALAAAKERGVAEGALEAARVAQRRATFLIDFVEAENSTGFHAPQEAARVLFTAMDHLRQGQMALTQPADALPAPASEAAPAVEAAPAPEKTQPPAAPQS